MRFPTCVAVSFALLTVAVSPLTAQAQNLSESKPLNLQERAFVQALNKAMEDSPNTLMRQIADRGKVDDGQLVCTALKLGKSYQDKLLRS